MPDFWTPKNWKYFTRVRQSSISHASSCGLVAIIFPIIASTIPSCLKYSTCTCQTRLSRRLKLSHLHQPKCHSEKAYPDALIKHSPFVHVGSHVLKTPSLKQSLVGQIKRTLALTCAQPWGAWFQAWFFLLLR